jgi:hypothetical protein
MIDYYFLILLLINIILFIKGFVTPAEVHKISNLKSIFNNTFAISIIFPIYYFLNRGKGNKILYFLNILLYALFSLAQGWSGIFFFIFIYELYFRSEQKINFKYILFTFVALCGGIFLYQYIFTLKIAFRITGTFNLYNLYNIQPISFEKSIFYIFSRLSCFSNIIATIQYKEEILTAINYIYSSENFTILKILTFIRDSFGSHMESVLKLIIHSIFAYLGYSLAMFKSDYIISEERVVSFGTPFLSVIYLLLSYNILQFILYIIFLIISVLFIKGLLDTFKDKDVYFVFFLTLMYFAHESGEISVAFFRQIIGYFIFSLILLVFKSIQKCINKKYKKFYP